MYPRIALNAPTSAVNDKPNPARLALVTCTVVKEPIADVDDRPVKPITSAGEILPTAEVADTPDIGNIKFDVISISPTELVDDKPKPARLAKVSGVAVRVPKDVVAD